MTTTITNGATTVTPSLITGYEVTQQSGNVLHPVLGRADVDVSFNPLGLRSGSLTFAFDTATHVFAARDLHASTGICVLADTDVPAVGMRYVPSGAVTVALDDETLTVWLLTVEFQEVV